MFPLVRALIGLLVSWGYSGTGPLREGYQTWWYLIEDYKANQVYLCVVDTEEVSLYQV